MIVKVCRHDIIVVGSNVLFGNAVVVGSIAEEAGREALVTAVDWVGGDTDKALAVLDTMFEGFPV